MSPESTRRTLWAILAAALLVGTAFLTGTQAEPIHRPVGGVPDAGAPLGAEPDAAASPAEEADASGVLPPGPPPHDDDDDDDEENPHGRPAP